MTIALCDGIFAYAFKETATKVHEKCLKLCGGSQELLSKIVQTRFLNDHSPLYMILANRLLGDDPQPADRAVPLRQTVPPLFNMLIQCSDLEATTQDDLLEVILRESAHQLYSALQAHLPKFSRPTPLSVFEDKTSFSSLGNNFFSFTIPKMGDRLMLREEISFQFVAQSMYILMLVVDLSNRTARLCLQFQEPCGGSSCSRTKSRWTHGVFACRSSDPLLPKLIILTYLSNSMHKEPTRTGNRAVRPGITADQRRSSPLHPCVKGQQLRHRLSRPTDISK